MEEGSKKKKKNGRWQNFSRKFTKEVPQLSTNSTDMSLVVSVEFDMLPHTKDH